MVEHIEAGHKLVGHMTARRIKLAKRVRQFAKRVRQFAKRFKSLENNKFEIFLTIYG
jgi:hypothetical protein